jgi:hypothetical protein
MQQTSAEFNSRPATCGKSCHPVYHDWAGLRDKSGKQLAAAFRSSPINDWDCILQINVAP